MIFFHHVSFDLTFFPHVCYETFFLNISYDFHHLILFNIFLKIFSHDDQNDLFNLFNVFVNLQINLYKFIFIDDLVQTIYLLILIKKFNDLSHILSTVFLTFFHLF